MSKLDEITAVAHKAIIFTTVAACDSYEAYKNHDESVFDCYNSKIKEHLVAIHRLFPYDWTHVPENVYTLFRATELVLDYSSDFSKLTWPRFRMDMRILLLKEITHDQRICKHNLVEKLLTEGDIIERYLRTA